MSVHKHPISVDLEHVLIMAMAHSMSVTVRVEQYSLEPAVMALSDALVCHMLCIATTLTSTNNIARCNSTACQNGGLCTAANICDCTGTGFIGDLCEIGTHTKCYLLPFHDYIFALVGCDPDCLNGGTCRSQNTCDCSGTGYSGNHCQIRRHPFACFLFH